MALTAAAKKKKQADEKAQREAAAQVAAPEEHGLGQNDPATDNERTIAEVEAAEAAEGAVL